MHTVTIIPPRMQGLSTPHQVWNVYAGKADVPIGKSCSCGTFWNGEPGYGEFHNLISDAVVSEDGRFRYRLRRIWAPGPLLLFVMLNPSTADAKVDDPTIRRCIGFAKKLGYGGIIVENLFAFRATNPRELLNRRVFSQVGLDTIGPENDYYIGQSDVDCQMAIAAWGAFPDTHRELKMRASHVLNLFRQWHGANKYPLHVLGLTKKRAPKHPLYLPGTAEPMTWVI